MTLNIEKYDPALNLTAGLFSGMPAEKYHAYEALSYSKIKILLDCPAKFFNSVESTPAMEFGTLFHLYVLEPQVFNRKVVVFDKDLRTKKAKEDRMALEQSGYEYFIKQKDLDNLAKMKKAVMQNPIGEQLLTDGYSEISYIFEREGILCKCRFDKIKIIDNCLFITDLKTTQSCSKDNLMKTIGQFNYHIQAAFYSDALSISFPEFDDVIFVNFFVESAKGVAMNNHISAIPIVIPTEDLEIGRQEYQRGIEIYKECTINNIFYDYDTVLGYENSICEIGLPFYKKNQINYGV